MSIVNNSAILSDSASSQQISNLNPIDGDMIQYRSGAYTNRSVVQIKSDMNLGIVATSNNYSDLNGKPTLGSASGSSTSDFAPSSGILKSALISSVQTSLNKADTSIQNSLFVAKGDVLVGGTGAPIIKSVGTNGQVLTANSGDASGIIWGSINQVPVGSILNGLWLLASFGNLSIPSGYWPLDGSVVNSPGSVFHGLTTPDTRGRVLVNAKASGDVVGTNAGSELTILSRANLPNVSVTTSGTFTPVGTISIVDATVVDTQPIGTTYKYDGTAFSFNTAYSGQPTNVNRTHGHTATFTGTNSAVSTSFNLNNNVTQTTIDNRQLCFYVTQVIKL